MTKGGTSWRLRGMLQLFCSTKHPTFGRCPDKGQWVRNTNSRRFTSLGQRHFPISTRSSGRWLGSPLPHHHRSIHCRRPPIPPRISFNQQTSRRRYPGYLLKVLLPRSTLTETRTTTAPSIEARTLPPTGMQNASGTAFCSTPGFPLPHLKVAFDDFPPCPGTFYRVIPGSYGVGIVILH